MNRINRRDFIKFGLASGALLTLGSGSTLIAKSYGKRDTQKKVLVLGLDGMDPHLLQVWMKQGKLPSFQKLWNQGDFRRLRTSIPPQSPVAWSNVITGMNPGGHGIFDFVHRDPENYFPEFSGAETKDPEKTIRIGNLILPLSRGEVKLTRKGRAFWQILEDYDIPATVFKMPSNYPPAATKQKTISGLGTPDLLGYLSFFNYYTTEFLEIKGDIGGGEIHEVYVAENRVETTLPGPINTFKREQPESSIDFKVFIDPIHPVAKIVIQDNEFILKEGEWSGWKRIHFRMIPTQSVSGICMFYLKQVRPEFNLYVSPINIDPAAAALPISTPKSYSEELEKRFGPFFTKGLPADTKALDNNVLDDGEFLEQDDFILDERLEMFDYELSRFDSGLLFYYVSSTDQRQHMFWRYIDKRHPLYDPSQAEKYGNTIENIYREMDRMLAKAMEKTDKETVLIVLSDHGFSPFRRSFNPNTWLLENGYHALINKWRQGRDDLFTNTDWSKTKAYALGLNSLYINQKGREREGIVNPGAEKEALIRKIIHRLESFQDPESGERPVLRAFAAQDVYSGAHMEKAPDIIIGYNQGYRVSWSAPLGRIPRKVLEDNTEKWSGDHCVAPEVVPGILVTNQEIKVDSPSLSDIAPTILQIYGIEKTKEMVGKPIF